MINRQLVPEVQSIQTIEFLSSKRMDLGPNCKLFWMNEVPDETAKVELYFRAGAIHASKKGLASIMNGFLLSGTATKSSTQIQNELNNLGAFYESNAGIEYSVISIYSLKENMNAILRIFQDAINNSIFDENELEELIADRKQKFKVNNEKVSTKAQRLFQTKLFDGTAYAAIVEEEDFEKITSTDLKSFYEEAYINGLYKIVVCGAFEEESIVEMSTILKGWASNEAIKFEANFANLAGNFHDDKKNALQTAIRIGRTLFNKNHNDYIDFQILNTILGDYFGSRLMTNIREDKGYTYGIGSMVIETNASGYFLIATEVGNEVKDAAIDEIKFEIERLKNELVPEEELNLVKNYMLGQLLKSVDGAYAMLDLDVNLDNYQLDSSYLDKVIDGIKKFTPARLQELAKKYLDWNKFTVVTAG
ncbi:MAG: pitrilysin family protein [Bacteroidota bacterium]